MRVSYHVSELIRVLEECSRVIEGVETGVRRGILEKTGQDEVKTEPQGTRSVSNIKRMKRSDAGKDRMGKIGRERVRGGCSRHVPGR